MPRGSVDMNLLFTLGEVQRLVRAMPTSRRRATASPARSGRCWPRWNAPKA